MIYSRKKQKRVLDYNINIQIAIIKQITNDLQRELAHPIINTRNRQSILTNLYDTIIILTTLISKDN